MSVANPLWGAPRIHGELLKLGIDIGQTSVAKYMARRRKPPSQGWKTFLRNHADGIAAMDLFVVPTISFRLLYGLLIMGHGRRQILWLGVTSQPTAEWIANQLTAACGWEQIPRDLIRDRDACYGSLFVRRVRSLGIRDHPTSARSPWQNGYAERLIGHRGDRRAASAPYPQMLHGVLQRGTHASIVGQRCAHLEGHPVRRAHRSAACAWWTAPSVRADLICGRDTG
jgi:transposase InsO family protein